MTMLMLDYQRNFRPLPRLGIALLLAALAWIAAIAAAYYDIGRALAARTAEAKLHGGHTSQAKPRFAPLGEQQARVQAQEMRLANEVLREIGAPWEPLFNAVEAAGGEDVTLLAMEPDTKKQVVRIAGEARNLAAVLEYMRRLGAQPALRGVQLQRHEVDQQDPERPVRFNLLAAWTGEP